MPFPETDRVVYKKNPLNEVICQLRFPTILEIKAREPAAYQKIIRKRYPLFEKEQSGFEVPKEIAGFLTQLSINPPGENVIYKFLTEDSQRAISLSHDFIAVSEKKYFRWEDFRKEIEIAKNAIEEVYEPAFYSRVGLRYRDVINRVEVGLEKEPWESLLNKDLIGILGAPEVCEHLGEVVTRALIKLDRFQNSFANLTHGLGKLPENDTIIYLIDVDLFVQERIKNTDVFQYLDEFNRIVGNLFRWAITPKLRDALEPSGL